MGRVANARPPPLYPQEKAPRPVWTGAGNLAPPTRFDPRTLQSVASRYTDYAIPAHKPSQ